MDGRCLFVFRIVLCTMIFVAAESVASSGAGSAHSYMRSELPLSTSTDSSLDNSTKPIITRVQTKKVTVLDVDSTSALAKDSHPVSSLDKDDALSNLQCGGQLTGVGFESVMNVLNRVSVPAPRLTGQEMLTLRSKKFFIAACLHQSELILPHWSLELIRLLVAMRQSTASGWAPNLFVSIYESGSTDSTAVFLKSLEGHLKFLGVPHRIILGGLERGHRNRIDFIADIRNRALEPLHNASFKYDYVLWLNDVFFCADGVVQMALHALPEAQKGLGADAVCGMDFILQHYKDYKRCIFYDIWVSHDMTGHNFNPRGQRVGHELLRTLWHRQPFQVFSCWNGMVIFKADLFQERLVKFRRNHWQAQECAASETELLFRDMWKLGRGKVAVSPSAASAYDIQSFRECSAQRQPAEFQSSPPITYKPPPQRVTCCPLREEAEMVNYGECFRDSWHAPSVAGWSTEGSSIALLSACILLFGFVIWHSTGLQEEQPIVVGCVIVCISILQIDCLNSLMSTLVFPLPMTMLGIQMAISSALLLVPDIQGLLLELWSKAGTVKRWSLLSPLFTLAFVTRSWLQRRDHTAELLFGSGSLPLLALLLEPIVFPGSKSGLWVLLPAELIALSTLLYAVTDDPQGGFDTYAWCYAAAHGSLMFCAHILERKLLVEPSMGLSLRAMAFVKNFVGLVVLLPVVIIYDEPRALPEFWAELQTQPVAWIAIICSGFAHLWYSYYLNFLLRDVRASSTFVLYAASAALQLYFQMVADGTLLLYHGRWCLFSLAGCAWYAKGRLVAESREKGAVLGLPPTPSRG